MTNQQEEKLTKAIEASCVKHGITGAKKRRLMKRVADHLFLHGLFVNVMQGHMTVADYQDGEPMFSLTDKGTRYVEDVLLAGVKFK